MSNTEVFIYTGEGGAAIPDDVVRVRIDPSITSIPDQAFWGRLRNNFTDVELCAKASFKLGVIPSLAMTTDYENKHSQHAQEDF